MIHFFLLQNLAEGHTVYNLVKDGNFFILSVPFLKTLDDHPCKISAVPDMKVYSTVNSLVFQKSWPFKEIFDHHILRMNEIGIIQKLNDQV